MNEMNWERVPYKRRPQEMNDRICFRTLKIPYTDFVLFEFVIVLLCHYALCWWVLWKMRNDCKNTFGSLVRKEMKTPLWGENSSGGFMGPNMASIVACPWVYANERTWKSCQAENCVCWPTADRRWRVYCQRETSEVLRTCHKSRLSLLL